MEEYTVIEHSTFYVSPAPGLTVQTQTTLALPEAANCSYYTNKGKFEHYSEHICIPGNHVISMLGAPVAYLK